MTVPPDQVLAALRWRYATKQFDASREIPADVWDALEESLVLTPSSFGLQPWKFLVVQDPTIRAELMAESWNQTQVTHASHFVVLTARGLNPRIRIISKCEDDESEQKLLRAGADSVVSSKRIGGLRMASEMIRPAVVSFLDIMVRDPQGYRVEEV